MFSFIYFIVVLLGYLSFFCLLAYLVLFIISKAKEKETQDTACVVNADNMPVMRPIPIPTAMQESAIDKLIAWILSVRKWQVLKAFEYKDKRTGIIYVIPAGFEFDGASIPRFFWALLSPIGLLLIPGLLHDFGYKYDGIYVKKSEDAEPQWSTDIQGKEAWDDLFRRVGDDVNGIVTLNTIATLGLIIGGFAAWNTWRDKKEPQPDMQWSVLSASDSNAVASSHNTTDKPKNNAKNNENNTKNEVNEDKEKEAATKAKRKPTKSTNNTNKTQTSKKAYELKSGSTDATQIGAVNENKQEVLGKIVTKDESYKNIYKLQCTNCNHVYGAKSMGVTKAKCPNCQDGKTSEAIPQ